MMKLTGLLFLLSNFLSKFIESTDIKNPRFLLLDRSKTLISPSIAKADICNLLSECSSVVGGGADMLHFSIQDGKFVPKISFGHDVIKALRPHFQKTVFDVKLSIIDPGDNSILLINTSVSSILFYLLFSFFSLLFPHFFSSLFPEYKLKDYLKAGADIISIHPEACFQPLTVIQMISEGGCVPGLVVNPSTSLETILYMIDYVDVIVFMIVSPGKVDRQD